jgi:hypothetical protein
MGRKGLFLNQSEARFELTQAGKRGAAIDFTDAPFLSSSLADEVFGNQKA